MLNTSSRPLEERACHDRTPSLQLSKYSDCHIDKSHSHGSMVKLKVLYPVDLGFEAELDDSLRHTAYSIFHRAIPHHVVGFLNHTQALQI